MKKDRVLRRRANGHRHQFFFFKFSVFMTWGIAFRLAFGVRGYTVTKTCCKLKKAKIEFYGNRTKSDGLSMSCSKMLRQAYTADKLEQLHAYGVI